MKPNPSITARLGASILMVALMWLTIVSVIIVVGSAVLVGLHALLPLARSLFGI